MTKYDPRVDPDVLVAIDMHVHVEQDRAERHRRLDIRADVRPGILKGNAGKVLHLA